MISLDNSDKKLGLGSETWLGQNLGPLGELLDSGWDRDFIIDELMLYIIKIDLFHEPKKGKILFFPMKVASLFYKQNSSIAITIAPHHHYH